MRWLIAALTLSTLTACGSTDSGDGPPPSLELGYGPASVTRFSAPISLDRLLGDWFVCEDTFCSRFQNEGVRFLADGRFEPLNAPGSLQNGEQYCVETQGRVGTYELRGETLVLSIVGNEPLTIKVHTSQSDVTWALRTTGSKTVQQLHVRKIDPPRSSGDCGGVPLNQPGQTTGEPPPRGGSGPDKPPGG